MRATGRALQGRSAAGTAEASLGRWMSELQETSNSGDGSPGPPKGAIGVEFANHIDINSVRGQAELREMECRRSTSIGAGADGGT